MEGRGEEEGGMSDIGERENGALQNPLALLSPSAFQKDCNYHCKHRSKLPAGQLIVM